METNYLIIYSYDEEKLIEKTYCTINELHSNRTFRTPVH